MSTRVYDFVFLTKSLRLEKIIQERFSSYAPADYVELVLDLEQEIERLKIVINGLKAEIDGYKCYLKARKVTPSLLRSAQQHARERRRVDVSLDYYSSMSRAINELMEGK